MPSTDSDEICSRKSPVPQHLESHKGDDIVTPTLGVTGERRHWYPNARGHKEDMVLPEPRSRLAEWEAQQDCWVGAKGEKQSLEVMRKVKKCLAPSFPCVLSPAPVFDLT